MVYRDVEVVATPAEQVRVKGDNVPTPLAIEFETKARLLMADIRSLAGLSEGLSDDEKQAIGERLQPEIDAMDDAMQSLFPGSF